MMVLITLGVFYLSFLRILALRPIPPLAISYVADAKIQGEMDRFNLETDTDERLNVGDRTSSTENDEFEDEGMSDDSDESANGEERLNNKESPDELKNENDEAKKKMFEETMQQFAREMAAGNMADLIGSNPHTRQPKLYIDLSRRFVPQYKYSEVIQKVGVEPDDGEIVPEKAPPELVLVIAKESALLPPDKSFDLGDDIDRLKILRSGDYWNGVWKEEVDPKTALRIGSQKKALGSVKVKIRPGTEFYKVVSRMKKISDRLLYIINKKKIN